VVRLIAERLGVRFEDATTVVEERPGQDAAYVIDSTRARTELAWAPRISIEEGLTDVVAWVEQHWDEIRKETLDYQHKA
jgi:dTDP-glucose 4,6-dehydratase